MSVQRLAQIVAAAAVVFTIAIGAFAWGVSVRLPQRVRVDAPPTPAAPTLDAAADRYNGWPVLRFHRFTRPCYGTTCQRQYALAYPPAWRVAADAARDLGGEQVNWRAPVLGSVPLPFEGPGRPAGEGVLLYLGVYAPDYRHDALGGLSVSEATYPDAMGLPKEAAVVDFLPTSGIFWRQQANPSTPASLRYLLWDGDRQLELQFQRFPVGQEFTPDDLAAVHQILNSVQDVAVGKPLATTYRVSFMDQGFGITQPRAWGHASLEFFRNDTCRKPPGGVGSCVVRFADRPDVAIQVSSDNVTASNFFLHGNNGIGPDPSGLTFDDPYAVNAGNICDLAKLGGSLAAGVVQFRWCGFVGTVAQFEREDANNDGLGNYTNPYSVYGVFRELRLLPSSQYAGAYGRIQGNTTAPIPEAQREELRAVISSLDTFEPDLD